MSNMTTPITPQAHSTPDSQIDFAALQTLADGRARQLDGSDGLTPSWHLWKVNEVNAVTAALAAQRPLLVRGEPGTGKSQLARAAAQALGWHLHTATMHVRSEPQDLLYQFDAVRRLADAQVQQLKDERRYWQPQALWLALDWELAQGYGSFAADQARPEDARRGHVVLIDEIDKAPSDVPNGLLEVLGARSFHIPALAMHVPRRAGNRVCTDAPWPLVIITTNEERDLPAAFLRRCMVLNHALGSQSEYQQFLIEHGLAHFGPGREGATAFIDATILHTSAQRLVQDRENARHAQLVPPGLAEYLDLLYALHKIAPGDTGQQRHWLDKLNQYAYLKNHIDDAGGNDLQQAAAGVRTLP